MKAEPQVAADESGKSRWGRSPWSDINKFALDEIKCIFDVGANIGQMARKFTEKFPNAQVYCFEPVMSTYDVLCKESEKHDNIKTFPIGLSDKRKLEKIYLQKQSEWNSINKNIDRKLGVTTIKLDTIDNICEKTKIKHINILKTDTEGHDLSVLTGAQNMLSNSRIDFVYSEVGFYKIDIGHTNFCILLELMQEFNFQFCGVYGMSGLRFIEHPTSPCYPWANALFVRNDLVQTKFGDQHARWISEVYTLDN